MIAFNTNEDVSLQTVVLQVDADTTMVGEAPQYYKNSSNEWISITENDPYWCIKQILKTGGNKISTRFADGSNRYNKVFATWNLYTY